MARIHAVVVGVLVGVMLFALPAMAQQYPPDEGTSAGVSETSVEPGEPITVGGDGWQPGSEVTIEFLSEPVLLGTATVDGDGQFSARVTIPADATAGDHTIRVSGVGAEGEPRVENIAVTVEGEAGRGAPGDGDDGGGDDELAATGGYFTLPAALGALLLVVGGGALYASRRLTKTPTA